MVFGCQWAVRYVVIAKNGPGRWAQTYGRVIVCLFSYRRTAHTIDFPGYFGHTQ